MIKEVNLTCSLADAAQAADMADLLESLGCERGDDNRSFVVPAARLRLTAERQNTPSVSLCFEVTGLEDIRALTDSWLGKRANGWIVSRIDERNPEKRSFLVEIPSGQTLMFWESSDPLPGKPVALAGDLSSEAMRFAIVVARWNAVITDRLLQGALDALLRSGASRGDVEIVRVPGAWEIPSAARKMAESGRFDAVITLGLLLRGETAHYEAIYQEVSRGIGQSQQESGIPHAFGVLTCDTLEQALDRAGLKAGNKGFEAACAAIEMVSLHRRLAVTATNACAPL